MTRREPAPQLAALVKQFADPFAFLRELIQNALDAGSNEVDIDVDYDPERGVGTISVQDYGEGMDRQIVETRLTRMFSSAKDGDQTKIGRFGIGFISVFGLEPDLVCVDTARGGQALRVLCTPDLSYELLDLDQPLEGTRVRLIKGMRKTDFTAMRRKAKRALHRWCRFVEPVIRFEGKPVNEPLLELARCQVSLQEQGTRMVVGYVDHPSGSAGYYNRGLTLWQGRSSLVPHVAYRIDSEDLEHTVSRDRVLKDERYEALVQQARELALTQLPRRLFMQLEEQTPHGPDRRYFMRAATNFLGRELAAEQGTLPLDIAQRAVIPMLHEGPISLQHAQGLLEQGRLHVAAEASPVTQRLFGLGYRFAAASTADGSLGMLLTLARSRSVTDLDLRFASAQPVSATERRAAPARALQRNITQLLATADEGPAVEFGHLAYPGSEVETWVAILQAEAFGLTPLSRAALRTEAPTQGCIVLNVDHPMIQQLVELAAREPELAAYLTTKLAALHGRLDSSASVELARRGLEARWTRLQT